MLPGSLSATKLEMSGEIQVDQKINVEEERVEKSIKGLILKTRLDFF